MLADFLRLLLRRRLLSLVAVLVAVGAGATVFVLIPPIQESTASVLFVPPSQDAQIDGTINPFLSLGGSLGVVPSVIQATVSDSTTADRIFAAGHKGEYTVIVDAAQNAAPILLITVDSHSAADSIGTTNAVVDEIATQLAALQQARAVDSRYLISTTVLTSTPKPLVIRTGQVQPAALAGAGVLVLGVALIGLASRAPDRAPGRRRARSCGGAAAGVSGATGATPTRTELDAPLPHRVATVDATPTPTRGVRLLATADEEPFDLADADTGPLPDLAPTGRSATRVQVGSRSSHPRRRAQQFVRPAPAGRTHEPIGSRRGGHVDGRI